MDALTHRSAAVRCQAVRTVWALDRLPAEVVAAHLHLLDSPNPRVRVAAEWSLWRMAPFRAQAEPYVPVLLGLVRSPRTSENTSTFQCQVAALNVLVEIAPDTPAVRQAFLECMDSGGTYVRRSAIQGLGAGTSLSDQEREALEGALSDSNKRNRAAARNALSNHKP